MSLKKDYRDLKIFKNEADIANARQKLLVFIRKLLKDTNELIQSIEKNLLANKKALENIELMKQRQAEELDDMKKFS